MPILRQERHSRDECVLPDFGLQFASRKVPLPESIQLLSWEHHDVIATAFILQEAGQCLSATALPGCNEALAIVSIVRHAVDLRISDNPIEVSNEGRHLRFCFQHEIAWSKV